MPLSAEANEEMRRDGPSQHLAIFAGPSRSPSLDAGAAALLPPARAGDVLDAATRGFSHLVLADTLFLDAPPNHREIIAAIARGATVYGCSSAGALRAIELAREGMIGCGVVHALYRTGRLRDDAELACVIGDDHQAVTPALLEIRYYLGYLLSLGVPLPQATQAFKTSSSIYYMRRDYAAVRHIIAEHVGSGELRIAAPIEDPAFRIKSIDLENCLADIAVSIQGRADPFRRVEVNPEWLARGLALGDDT